jgi:hypothetical protein
MRRHPAPKAARIASSWRRPSARTRSRFATLAQAINNTMPTVPISTQSVPPISPTRTSWSGRRLGAMRASVYCARLKLGLMGNFVGAISSIRPRSALACASVTPGLSLAMPWQQKLNRRTSARLNRKGSSAENPAIQELKRRRQHADHRMRIAIQHDAAAKGRRIPAEARLPIAVRDHHRPLAPRIILKSYKDEMQTREFLKQMRQGYDLFAAKTWSKSRN